MRILFISILILPVFCFGQAIVGTGIGVSGLKKAVYNLQFAYNLGRHSILYNQYIPLSNKVNSPIVLGVKYGYNIYDLQVALGVDYQVIRSEKYKNPNNFHVSYGISKYFRFAPIKLDAALSGKYLTVCLVIYKLID